MRKLLLAAILIAPLTVTGACRRSQPAPEPAPVRVESPGLGLAIAALPAGFEVETNEGEVLELGRSAADDPARLFVELGPLQPGGVDLVAWVEAQPAELEGLPDGVFRGTRKLRTPIGDAYTARGTYAAEVGEREETRVLAVHPSAPRLLTVRYVYRSGDDTTTRINQLLDVFAEIEPLAQ